MVNYYSIKGITTHEINIKKSRFITYLIPIGDETLIADILGKIRKEHYKANHHCYAYILGEDGEIQKASDDGEPSGTAGQPILEVLKQKQLTKLIAIVVRYFGGIKLGAGGLIRAYATSVSTTLEKAPLIQNVDQDIIQIQIGYSNNDLLLHYIDQANYTISILDKQFTEQVTYQLGIYPQDTSAIYENLMNLFKGQLNWELIETRAIDIICNP